MKIPFSKPTIGTEEIKAVTEVLRSGNFTPGVNARKFEKLFAKYTGVKYAVLTNCCTSALKMAFKYAKEELKLKTFTYPLNTYCATYSSGYEYGLKGFPDKHNSPKIDIGVIVHYGGVKANTAKHKFVIEDSAHRIVRNDPMIGDVRCYSFHPNKSITTGTGGMFTTNNEKIYEKIILYSKDGINKKKNRQYDVECYSGGFDGNEIIAALGIEQLKKLPQFDLKRNKIRDLYNKELGQKWMGDHIYPYFVSKHEEVIDLIRYLERHGIQASYHYPNTGWLGVSLPIYPGLSLKNAQYVIKCVSAWRKRA